MLECPFRLRMNYNISAPAAEPLAITTVPFPKVVDDISILYGLSDNGIWGLKCYAWSGGSNTYMNCLMYQKCP